MKPPTDAPRASVFRTAAMLGGATGSAQVLAVLVAPLLTRLYEPEDFGVYGAAIALISMIAPLGVLRYEQGLLLARSPGALSAVLAASAAVALVILPLTAVVLFVGAAGIAGALGSPALEEFIWLVPIGVAAAVGISLAATLAVRQRAFKHLARMKLVQGLGISSGHIASGMVGAGGIGMVVADISARVVAMVILALQLSGRARVKVRLHRTRRIAWALTRYRRFPLYSGPSVLFNAVSLHGPTIVFLALYGPAVGGLYLLVQRVGGVPVSLVGMAVAHAYLGEAVDLRRTKPEAMGILFKRTVYRLALVAALPTLAVIVLAPAAVPIVFGPAWADAGVFLAVLAPMFAAQLVATPIGDTVDVIERQDLRLLREIVRFLLVGSALATVAVTQASPTVAVVALSIAGVISYVSYAKISWAALAAHGRAEGTPGIRWKG